MEGHRNRRVIEVNDEEWHRTRRALEERLKLPPRIWKVVQLLISGITDNPELSKRLSVTPGSLSQYLEADTIGSRTRHRTRDGSPTPGITSRRAGRSRLPRN